MNKSLSFNLSPRALGILLGVLALACAAGGDIYLQFVFLSVPKVEPVTTSYPTDKVLSEMASGGVFEKTKNLVPISNSIGTAVTSVPADLGKDDLSKYSQ